MTEPSKPKSGRLVKGLLIVSLGINLVIGGMAVGVWSIDKATRLQSPDGVAFLSFALPKEHRNALREQLVERREELRNNRAELANMRRLMVEALEAEPFEISAVESILQRQRERFVDLGELAHSALLERISLLSTEERAAYVESLKKEPRRPRR